MEEQRKLEREAEQTGKGQSVGTRAVGAQGQVAEMKTAGAQAAAVREQDAGVRAARAQGQDSGARAVGAQQDAGAARDAENSRQVVSETWAEETIADLDDFIESQGIYIRQ